MKTRENNIENIAKAELLCLEAQKEMLFDSKIVLPVYNLNHLLPKINSIVDSLKSSFQEIYGEELRADYKPTLFSAPRLYLGMHPERHRYKVMMANLWNDPNLAEIKTIPQAIFVHLLWKCCLSINESLDADNGEFGKALKSQAEKIRDIQAGLRALLDDASFYWQQRINIIGYVSAYDKEREIEQDAKLEDLDRKPMPDFYINETLHALEEIQRLTKVLSSSADSVLEVAVVDSGKLMQFPEKYPEITGRQVKTNESPDDQALEVMIRKKRMTIAVLSSLNNNELFLANPETAFLLAAQEITRKFLENLSAKRRELLFSRLVAIRKSEANHFYSAITRKKAIPKHFHHSNHKDDSSEDGDEIYNNDQSSDYLAFYQERINEPNPFKFNYNGNMLDLSDVFTASTVKGFVSLIAEETEKYKNELYIHPKKVEPSMDELLKRQYERNAEKIANPHISDADLIPLYRDWQHKVNALRDDFIKELTTLVNLDETLTNNPSYEPTNHQEKMLLELIKHARYLVDKLIFKEQQPKEKFKPEHKFRG